MSKVHAVLVTRAFQCDDGDWALTIAPQLGPLDWVWISKRKNGPAEKSIIKLTRTNRIVRGVSSQHYYYKIVK